MKKKKQGFIFISVLALLILVTSVAMSTAVVNMTYAGEVSENTGRDKLYYISSAGLEMVYGALNHVDEGKSVMSNIQKDIGTSQTYNIKDSKFKLAEQDLEIKGNSRVFGYSKVSGNLEKKEYKDEGGNTKQEYYYRIVSKGSLEKNESDPKKISTMTMFVYINSPNSPKVYNGDKKIPN